MLLGVYYKYFQVYVDHKQSHFIDGENRTKSNWMRYVNCACNEEQQNLTAFQLHGEIYYKTIRAVNIGEELLVWYEDECGVELGLLKQLHLSTCSYLTHTLHEKIRYNCTILTMYL